jgi:preprotein translocase subunit Sss1
MDAAKSVAEPLNGFMIESMRLVRRCNKPDRKGMGSFIARLSFPET